MTTCCLLSTFHKICNVKNFIVFVLILCFDSYWIHVIYSPIFFRVASLALGQSYDCPSASEATLKSKGNHNHTQKPMNHMHISWDVFYAVSGSFRALFSYCYTIIVYNDAVGCTMFHLFSYPSVKSCLLILCTVMSVFIFFQLSNWEEYSYRKTSNISRTLVGNEIVDNSNVVGASPVGTAPTTSSFST